MHECSSLPWGLTLSNPIDWIIPSSSVHGILRAGMLEWIVMPSSREDLLHPGIKPAPFMSPAWAGRFFTASTI